jgi:hypothetical protein
MNGRLDRLLTLSLVAPGQRVRVVEITADQPVSHRLMRWVLCGAQPSALYRMMGARC